MPSPTNIKNFLLDIIFPKSCFGCGDDKHWLCPACSVSIIGSPPISACPLCQTRQENDLGRVCIQCRPESDLEGIIAAGAYQSEVLKNAIHALKYQFAKEISQDLAKLIVTKIQSSQILGLAPAENFLLVPVPLHKKREKYRGFNQSKEIAEHLHKSIGLPTATILRRTKNTKPQVDLSGASRQKNVSDAFIALPNIDLTNRIIFLVDDVATTGSTLLECAKVLKPLNPYQIWGLVVARG
jgi:ComF family protein